MEDTVEQGQYRSRVSILSGLNCPLQRGISLNRLIGLPGL